MPLSGNMESDLLMMDGERMIGRIADLETEADGWGVWDDADNMKQLHDKMGRGIVFEAPVPRTTAEKLRKICIPKGIRNGRILKRDGYLSIDNADST